MNNDFFEQFKGYLSTTKNCSKNTLDAYLRDVSQFITYCSQNGFKNTTDVNSDFLVKYIDFISSYDIKYNRRCRRRIYELTN